MMIVGLLIYVWEIFSCRWRLQNAGFICEQSCSVQQCKMGGNGVMIVQFGWSG